MIDNLTPSQSRLYPRFDRILLILALITAARILILTFGLLELSGDEAHYWEWSRRLDWCYYSKPPMVAWLIKAGTAIFGNTELGVRCMAPILSFLSSLIIYQLGTIIYGPAAGAFSALTLQAIPLFSTFGIGLTPDSPLLFFWSLSLLFLYRAWASGKKRYWLGLTLSLGLGMLGKYAITFFFLPALLLLFTTPIGRKRLKTPWPWLSLLGSFIFFIPVIYWNSQHNWVMFRHDLGHTHTQDGLHITWMKCLEFIGGQLGIVTPILAVMILYLVVKQRNKDPFCFWMVIPVLIGFLIKSLQGSVQPNWAMPGWIAGVLPLGYFFTGPFHKLNVHWRRTASTGLIIAVVGSSLLHMPFILVNIPWPQGKNPVNKLVGWRQMGQEVSRAQKELGQDKPCFVISDRYMYSSALAFYTEGHPQTYCVNLGRRMNQYDLWPGFDQRIGDNAVFVSRYKMADDFKQAFESVETRKIELKNNLGHTIRTAALCLCRNFKGWQPKKIETY